MITFIFNSSSRSTVLRNIISVNLCPREIKSFFHALSKLTYQLDKCIIQHSLLYPLGMYVSVGVYRTQRVSVR